MKKIFFLQKFSLATAVTAMLISTNSFAFDKIIKAECGRDTTFEVFDNLSNQRPPSPETFALIHQKHFTTCLPSFPGRCTKLNRYIPGGQFKYSVNSAGQASLSLNDGTLDLKNCTVTLEVEVIE